MSTRREDSNWERAWSVEIERRGQDVTHGRVHADLRTEIERRAREALTDPEGDVSWEALRAELHASPTRW